jgi:Ca2+-binding EF-hand superfamily protein
MCDPLCEQLHAMLREVGVHEDEHGAITEDGFFEFIRKTLVADLPSSKLPLLRASFERAVNTHRNTHDLVQPKRAPPGVVAPSVVASAAPSPALSKHRSRFSSRERSSSSERLVSAPAADSAAAESVGAADAVMTQPETQALLRTLGFHLDETTFLETFTDVDSDDDGAITLEELITCVGMLKRSVLEVRALERSFARFRQPCQTELEEHRIYAHDLVAALGVSEQVAEEMIFIADLEDNQSITFTEFRQVVCNWD